VGSCTNANRDSAKSLTITPRENAAGFVLGACRRRVFENTRQQKQRLDPEWSQLRNFEFVGRDRRADQQRDRRMIEITGGNERDRARVIDAIRIGVKALVELRRNAQRQRPEKRGRSNDCDKSTSGRAAFHWRRL